MQVNVTYYFKSFAYGGGTITTSPQQQLPKMRMAFEKE